MKRKTTAAAALAATAGFLSLNGAAMAATYDAYCGGKNNCKIVIDSRGVSGPSGFIPAGGVLQWYQGGEGETFNAGAGVAGATAGAVGGAVLGAVATCWTIVLCPIGFFGGLGAGAAGGAGAGNRSEHTFTVIGYTEQGQKVSHEFWFVNKKPSNKVLQNLPVMTGLAMGQVRPIETIAKALNIELTDEPTAAPVKAADAPSVIGATRKRNKPIRNCWTSYLTANPNMKVWADANPAAAAKTKAKYDDC